MSTKKTRRLGGPLSVAQDPGRHNIHPNPIAWDSINWKSLKQRIGRIQLRIFKASSSRNKNKLYWLQNSLIHSLDAKLFAIQKITEFQKSLNNKEKLSLVQNLKIDTKPISRPWAQLDFWTLPNQAKQVLVQLALEPEWKAQGRGRTTEKTSSQEFWRPELYQDAIHAIYMSLGKNRKWIYPANIREYWNTINPDFLLKKIQTSPIMELQIRNWLNQGLFVQSTIQNNQWIFSRRDMSQKRQSRPSRPTGLPGILPSERRYFSIEYLLVNIALHGLESHLKDFVENRTLKRQTESKGLVCVPQHNPENQQKFVEAPADSRPSAGLPQADSLRLKPTAARRADAPLFVRYGYDFVIIHESKEIITLCINEIQQWLWKTLQAKWNREQFFLKDGPNGFYFLDFQIIQIKKNNQYKVKIRPSKKSQNAFLLKIRNILQKNKATSAYQLIQKLRPIIIDWGDYFKFYDYKVVYRSLTNQILKKIRAWVFRRDTRSSRHKIKRKYFPENKIWIFNGQKFQSHWVLYGQKKEKNGGATRKNFLPHLSWFTSNIKHKELNKGCYLSCSDEFYEHDFSEGISAPRSRPRQEDDYIFSKRSAVRLQQCLALPQGKRSVIPAVSSKPKDSAAY